MIEINLRPGQKRARGGSPFAGLQAQLSGLRERMRDPLPLVAAGLIRFELIPLAPYPGFARLFASADTSPAQGGSDA